MKNFYLLIVLLISLFYTSCSVVEGIFKAGMYWGIFLVVLVIGLIIWIISRMAGRK